jgi:hypothetical protein
MGFHLKPPTLWEQLADERQAEKEQAEKMERSLRNCLMLATRNMRKEGGDWEHIIRFCKEAGVEPSFLRGQAINHIILDDDAEMGT